MITFGEPILQIPRDLCWVININCALSDIGRKQCRYPRKHDNVAFSPCIKERTIFLRCGEFSIDELDLVRAKKRSFHRMTPRFIIVFWKLRINKDCIRVFCMMKIVRVGLIKGWVLWNYCLCFHCCCVWCCCCLIWQRYHDHDPPLLKLKGRISEEEEDDDDDERSSSYSHYWYNNTILRMTLIYEYLA